jgi:hypothetical protein
MPICDGNGKCWPDNEEDQELHGACQPSVTLLGAASAIWVGVIVFTAVAGAYKQPHREDGFRKIRISFLPSLRTLFER